MGVKVGVVPRLRLEERPPEVACPGATAKQDPASIKNPVWARDLRLEAVALSLERSGPRAKRSSGIIWILLGFLLAGCNQPPSGLPFDPHIEGLKLVKLITGDDAIKAINQLHGRPINVVRGFIAHYEGVHDKATIWVSEASSKELAKRQIAVMIHQMKNNRSSPFSHYRALNIKGLGVIAFDGMGQVHYVFRDNKLVYWISADAKRMDKIMKHVYRAG